MSLQHLESEESQEMGSFSKSPILLPSIGLLNNSNYTEAERLEWKNMLDYHVSEFKRQLLLSRLPPCGFPSGLE